MLPDRCGSVCGLRWPRAWDRRAVDTTARAGWCAAICWIGLVAASAAPGRGDEWDEPVAEGRKRLEQMSDTDKVALLEKKRRFDELAPDEQERLRRIHQALVADADRDELWQVLERYHNWLRTLPPAERAEVLSLPADERLARVQELIRSQDARRFRMMVGGFMMSPKDLTTIHQWFDAFLDAHASAILATLPNEHFAQFKQNYDPDRDRDFLRFFYFRSPAPELPRPSREDEARLQSLVSRSARAVLEQAPDDERSRIIQRWAGAAALSRMRTNPSVEELQEFAQVSLTDAERFRLESLPRDRMYRELRMLYSQRRFGGEPGGGLPRVRPGRSAGWAPETGVGPGGPVPPGPPDRPPPWGDFPGKPPRPPVAPEERPSPPEANRAEGGESGDG